MSIILFNKKNGFSIIEMLTTVSIILICASLLLGSIYCAREKAAKTVCINNQRQLALAVMLFAYDEEKFPEQLSKLDGRYIDAGIIKKDFFGGSKAYALTTPSGYYNNVEGILACPKALYEEGASYGYNIYLQNINYSQTDNSSNIVALADSDRDLLRSSLDGVQRHTGGIVAAFVDGHVKVINNIFPFPIEKREGIPDPQTDPLGFTIDILNVDDNGDGPVTITIRVTSDNDEDTPSLSNFNVGLPEGARDMAKETARSGMNYPVFVVNPDPITGVSGIKFDQTFLGESGKVESEFFEFEVPAECIGETFTIEMATKAGEDFSVTEFTVER